ncbi:MAG: PSD1 and planctomycete cytochrome C domain-containing protein [Pirellulales bacterium]
MFAAFNSHNAAGRFLVRRLMLAWLIAVAPLAAVLADDAPPPTAEEIEFFEAKIRPVLAERCYSCHSSEAKDLKASLALDNRAGVVRGGENGPVINDDEPEKSLLLAAIRHDDSVSAMPPDGKLPDEVIADFAHWVKLGAPDPRAGPAALPRKAASADDPRLWALRPVATVEPPPVTDESWPRTRVDRFILARLEAAGLGPSPDADRPTLIRRLHYDLIGLPPTASQVAQFVSDASPHAVEHLIDRLLASPQFGERWARHWLDVSRYADTKGYVFMQDRNYAEAYLYRDWVVRSLNEDLPFDQFVLRQLAADRLPADQQQFEAMGFLTLGRRFLNNQQDIIDDRIDVVSRGLMGLTLSCARCHDHKYDPLTALDYYALYGVFGSSQEPGDAPSALRMIDKPQTGNHRVLLRGNPGSPGPEAPRQFPAVLSPHGPQPLVDGSGRLDLAKAIVAGDNPLTARVFVNRVWTHLFDKGLVLTPSDFGSRSDPPSHPHLLDDLARRFMDQGWSVKQLIRSLVMSRVYQQQSQERAEASQADPENRLLWKMNRRRVDFEGLRDALLAASDKLDLTLGGPSVEITQPPFSQRRTIYGFIDRQNLPGVFRTFDFANPDTHSPQRLYTSVPQQALFLLNSPFVAEQAVKLAERAEQAASGDVSDTIDIRLRQTFLAAYAREPSSDELAWSREFIETVMPTSADQIAGGWQYGYGELDVASRQIKSFQQLPHWTGQQWQGGDKLPDASLGWVLLNAAGGHPGNDASHAAIRRWMAPFSGEVSIRGKLAHPREDGDGVQGLVVLNQTGVVGEWIVHHGEQQTALDAIMVQAGDTIDFVAGCRDNPNHDAFQWNVQLKLSSQKSASRRYDSAGDFGAGKPPAALTTWQRLAQVLLMSNEFQFVD